MAGRSEFHKSVDEVAAVCYRRVGGLVEFLLVRTKGGARWTFPKGHIEGGEPAWRAAEREAWEEAGVRGRIASDPCAIYPHEKHTRDGQCVELTVAAYLLEVESDSDTPEPGREPTWFSPEQARQKLAENRPPRYQQAYARVLDEACRKLASPGQEVASS
jgi:8-oxo-dGTP pyrophosphatase MutT (NUDIX family)